MNIPLILFLVLCWPEEVNSRVSYSLKLISFSNPDGTSWDQLRYHGNRRLCDSRSTDECDTYFKICIQMRGKCFINHDSKVYPNSNNITFGNDATWTGTTNNWDSNLRSFINPFDKDSPNKPGDLIDILNFPLSVWPGLKQECTGHQPIVMTNHTTLIMEFKAWCSPGYSGPGCTFRYTGSDPYGSCNNGSMNLQCANEEPAIVRYSSYTPSNSTSIQSFEQHIGAFLKNHICDTLRLDSKQSLWSHSRVGFIAKCGDKPVDPIVVQAALGTGGYQNQGSLKIVPTPLNNYRQGMNVVAIFAVKIQSYTNQDRTCKTKGTRKCCDGGNLPHCDTDTCDTHFRICVNNDIHNTGSGSCITTRVRPDTNELSTCGDVRVNHTTNQLDVASTYISVTEFWTWNNTYIHVEVRDADDGNKYDTVDVLTLKQDLTPGHWDLSGATAESVQLHGHVSLRLRLLVWCAAHKYGKNCDVQCTPSGHGSCDPDTGAAVCQSGYAGSGCHDIDECKEHYCHGPGTHRCNNLAGSYQCNCNGGWTGKNCSQDVDECNKNPCHHGGTCNNTVGSYTCLCPQGYTGKNCDHDVDECQHNPCQHGGTCHNTAGSYTCTCHGFDGKNCTQDIDECQAQNPCHHGGTCINTIGSYTCSCHGFTGKSCESDIDECQHLTCPHDHMHCVNTVGSYQCPCNTGWTGDQCNTDVNECGHNPCHHGGTCNNTVGSYTCLCQRGYAGKTCVHDIDECQHNPCQNGGKCQNTPGSYTCRCHGFGGKTCTHDIDECQTQHPCQHGGTCTNTVGSYTCSCHGFTGKNCENDIDECQHNPCQNGGKCHNTVGSYTCSCHGFTGKNCENDINECQLNPCQNGGKCHNTAGSYTCRCHGFGGKTCTRDIDECQTQHPCQHGGTCNNTVGSYKCLCVTGWTGTQCNTDVNECHNNPCQHGGTCNNVDGNYTCQCRTGWTGRNCDRDVNECETKPHVCQNGGTCHNTDGGYHCSCSPGWTGHTCTSDVDECHQHVCKNNATCNNTHGSYKCLCTKGWHGDTCNEDVNECTQHNPCEHHSQCTNTNGDYHCKCNTYWTGKNCSEDVNECNSANTCHHGGTCSNHNNGFSCSCTTGWTGKTCETDVDECKNQGICHNRGQCINNIGSFRCNCTHGWTGNICQTDVNECHPSQCLHGATCENSDGSFKCNCPPGWTGHLCEHDLDECQHNTCQHNSNCTNTEGDYTCKCDGHWTGKNCTEDIDECKNNPPCHNGGTCSNHVGGFSCSCHKGWTGNTCESDVDECKTNPPCHNGGTCSNSQGGFLCSCTKGWTGHTCDSDVNECENHRLCHNGGKCINTNGGFICNCTHGWTGDLCQTDFNECEHNPCLHHGRCQNTGGSFNCHCLPGWTGHLCDEDVNECQHNPCQYNGNCTNTEGDYTCKCDAHWTGKNCTEDIDECVTNHPCHNGGTCSNHVGGFSCSCPKGWAGNTCESDVDECELFNRCNGSDLCVNIRGSFLCSGSSESTTSNYSSSTSTMAYSYESYVDAISLQCSEDAWKVHIHVPELYKRHVDFDPSDIYLGEPGCEGYRSGDFLVIYQQYSNCLTHHSMTSGSDVYTNTLVYALRDANYKFIIREFRFRIDLECNMAKQVTVSQHFIETNNQVRRRSNNPRISGHGYYNVLMAFYRDPNFLHQMTGHSVMDTSPLPVDIGTDIYVKLATHVTNTDVKMRLDVCYTLPSPGAGDSLKFYLIRNACVTDVNTRVLSILPHETKFVFRDFEYSTDLHNLYLYCTVTFCNRTDNSSLCDEQCHQRSPRSVVYPANGRYLHRISTSRVIPRPNVKGQRTSIPDEPGQSESHKHTGGIIFISSVLLVAVSVTSAILMMIQLRQNHERHDDDTNDI